MECRVVATWNSLPLSKHKIEKGNPSLIWEAAAPAGGVRLWDINWNEQPLPGESWCPEWRTSLLFTGSITICHVLSHTRGTLNPLPLTPWAGLVVTAPGSVTHSRAHSQKKARWSPKSRSLTSRSSHGGYLLLTEYTQGVCIILNYWDSNYILEAPGSLQGQMPSVSFRWREDPSTPPKLLEVLPSTTFSWLGEHKTAGKLCPPFHSCTSRSCRSGPCM